MYETTQVTYGDGTITVTMSSESTNGVAAPDIRFGDFNEAARCCFSEKELEEISAGESATVSFDFLMADAPLDEQEHQQFLDHMPVPQQGMEAYQEGVYFDVEALRTVGDGDAEPFNSFSEDVEMQFDVPLYLMTDDREHYMMTNVMGACELLEDQDQDADTLTVKTHNIGTMLILYQELPVGSNMQEKGFHIGTRHLLAAGIIILVAIWFVIDRIHKTQ
jgi:hypothetical protein